MGIQIIATNKKGNIIGEFEDELEFMRFQRETGFNVAHGTPIMHYDVRTKSGRKSQKKCWLEIIQDSPLYDEMYFKWLVCEAKKDYMFPSMRGTRNLSMRIQEIEYNELLSIMKNNDSIVLWVGNDKVSFDYFVSYCYETKKPKKAMVSMGKFKKVKLTREGTPEMSILRAIKLFQTMQKMIDNPYNYDEEEIRETFRRYYYLAQ